MKAAIVAVGLALLIAAPAWAQTANAPADKERLALAQEYVAATGGVKQARAQSKAMFDTMFAGLAKNLSAGGEVHLDKMRHELTAMTDALYPQILDDMAEIYAEDFSADELRDMLHFMKSPTGQAMVQKLPMVTQQIMAKMVPLITTEMPKMATRMVDDVCQDQHCTAEQRSALLAKVSPQLPGAASR